jgi:hypothetical protein
MHISETTRREFLETIGRLGAALDASRERRAALSVALVTTAGSRKSAQLVLEVSNVQWLAEPK